MQFVIDKNSSIDSSASVCTSYEAEALKLTEVASADKTSLNCEMFHFVLS